MTKELVARVAIPLSLAFRCHQLMRGSGEHHVHAKCRCLRTQFRLKNYYRSINWLLSLQLPDQPAIWAGTSTQC